MKPRSSPSGWTHFRDRVKIVEDDDIARHQRGGQLGFDVGLENLAVHGFVDDPGRSEAIGAQGGDEGLGSPMSERCAGLQTLPPPGTSPLPGHFGGCRGLIKEHQPMRLLTHPGLAVPTPDLTVLPHISATGLGCQQSFF